MKKNTFKKYLYALGVVLVALVLFKPDSHEQQLITVAAKTLPKTVMIRVEIEEPLLIIKLGDIEVFRSTETVRHSYLGSGVFISPEGHVLTVAHLFDNGIVRSIAVLDYNGTVYPAELLNFETKKDLALVLINEKTPNYANLADPRKLKVGQEVIAIGNPLSLEFTVTHGIISYLYRDFPGHYNVTQSDTFINPGNSGGPLFNLKGELVGINSFMIPPVNAPVFTGCGFSVQVSQIVEFLTKFKGLNKAIK